MKILSKKIGKSTSFLEDKNSNDVSRKLTATWYKEVIKNNNIYRKFEKIYMKNKIEIFKKNVSREN